jgi:hypothetical protein
MIQPARARIEFEMNLAGNSIFPTKEQIRDGLPIFQCRVATSPISVSNVDGDVADGQEPDKSRRLVDKMTLTWLEKPTKTEATLESRFSMPEIDEQCRGSNQEQCVRESIPIA